MQAKGPKGQRLVIKAQAEDPHHLNEVTDPVFSPSCSVRGIKVSWLATCGKNNASIIDLNRLKFKRINAK